MSSGNSVPQAIDKYINSAFDIVKLVADNLDNIENVSESVDLFDAYLGYHASAPTLRNNGEPLQEGDFYFNEEGMFFYYEATDGSPQWAQLASENISEALEILQRAEQYLEDTKEYVDNSVSEMEEYVDTNVLTLTENVEQMLADYSVYLAEQLRIQQEYVQDELNEQSAEMEVKLLQAEEYKNSASTSAAQAQASRVAAQTDAQAASIALAEANARLDMGIGSFYLDSDGFLFTSYNTDSVTSMALDENGFLIMEVTP